jgi:hypothetical protein
MSSNESCRCPVPLLMVLGVLGACGSSSAGSAPSADAGMAEDAAAGDALPTRDAAPAESGPGGHDAEAGLPSSDGATSDAPIADGPTPDGATGGCAGDGSANAPQATIQHPALLSGYATRSPCKVAGVDYAVGVPNGTLADWQTISMPGVTVDTSNSYVRVDGTTGATFDGYDFSLHGGASLFFVNSPNGVVKNCNFGGTNLTKISAGVILSDATSQGLTVEYSTIDGGGLGSGSTLVAVEGTGAVTLRYDWLKSFPQHVLEIDATGVTLDYRYNLVEMGGMTPGAHLNFLQWPAGNGPYTFAGALVAFNTSYQVPEAAGGEGYQFDPGTSTMVGSFESPTFEYNTMIAAMQNETLAQSYMVHGTGMSATVTGGQNAHNFFDASGAYGAYYPNSFTQGGWNNADNVDMVTGHAITKY